MKRNFKVKPILASTSDEKYYLVDAEGNRYYADKEIKSILEESAEDFYDGEDIGYSAAASVDYLEEWAFNDAVKELGLSGIEHLYIPKELEGDYFDIAYDSAVEFPYAYADYLTL